jgi:hypothetical protein
MNEQIHHQLCPMCGAMMHEEDENTDIMCTEVYYECPYCDYVEWITWYWFIDQYQREKPIRMFMLSNGELLKIS